VSAAGVASAALSDDDLCDADTSAADLSTVECDLLHFATAAHRNKRDGGSSAEFSTGIQLYKSPASAAIDLSCLTLRDAHGDDGSSSLRDAHGDGGPGSTCPSL
jgi:hypothetical protein